MTIPAAVERGGVVALIDLMIRRMRADLGDGIDPGAFPELSGSRFRLLAMIPDGGARPTDLAETAMVSKQALGQLVQHLVGHGYAELVPDPADGRARVVRRTERGDAAAGAAIAAIARMESLWRAEVGEERWRGFVGVLRSIATGGLEDSLEDGG